MVEGCTIQDAITVINLQYLKEKTAFIYRADGPHLSRGASKSVAIFGDTAPCEAALALAQGVDVMVHETTLDTSMEEKANGRGHSSTRQTATLAREAAVGRLIMTHISSRYDDKGCQRLLAECRAIFPATELAYDFSVFPV